jgi:putative flippase GtrA
MRADAFRATALQPCGTNGADAISEPMQSSPEPELPKARQSVRQRLLWFFVGAGVNYLLIATPFKYLQKSTNLPLPAIAACSMAVSTTFFFFWNYFVNFRTDSRKRDAFGRYVAAVIVLWALSSTILTIFKSFKTPHIGAFPLDLDVIATQACLGWLKFIVYHKWAFPVAKENIESRGSLTDA